MDRLVLASKSPRRARLLRFILADFDMATPMGLEQTEGEPSKVAAANACSKANETEGALVLGADTVVAHGPKILHQPTSPRAAAESLRQASIPHEVITAVALRRGSHIEQCQAATRVTLHAPPAIIDAYVASGAWQGKAGGYGIQDALLAPFVDLAGPWSNVVGLPLEATAGLLTRCGIATHPPPSPDVARPF